MPLPMQGLRVVMSERGLPLLTIIDFTDVLMPRGKLTLDFVFEVSFIVGTEEFVGEGG